MNTLSKKEMKTIVRDLGYLTQKKRMPKERLERAIFFSNEIRCIAESVLKYGGDYSGIVRRTYALGQSNNAETVTSDGDKYSRSCKWSKTDAHHMLNIDIKGIITLTLNEYVNWASRFVGIPLIALYADGSCVWVKTKNKQITAQEGWIAYDGTTKQCYHSVKSFEHAQRGLAEKVKIWQKEESDRRQSFKEQRRAKLIARLCKSVTATYQDARALGFCEAGIESFKSRFGIGNEATLPALMATGDFSARRLALHIARKISKQGGAA